MVCASMETLLRNLILTLMLIRMDVLTLDVLYYVFLGDNLMSQFSKCQHIISRSSANVEVASVVAESYWLCNLLLGLHFLLLDAILVYSGNVSVIYLFDSHVQH